MVRLVGSLYNDAGEALASANVAIFPTSASADEDTGTGSATDTTTTNSSGVWTSTSLAANSYDVRIQSGTSIRWRRFADEVQFTRASFGDDAGIDLGTCSDIVMFNRSTTLCADVEVAGITEGTSDHLGVAANSLIVSNLTNDGDIMFIVSDNGDSKGLLKLCGANSRVIVHGGDLLMSGAQKIYFNDIGGEYMSSDGSTLTITGATALTPTVGSTAWANANHTHAGSSTGGTIATSTLASTVVVVDSTDTSAYVALFDSATGCLAAKTDAGITYNAGTGMLTATGFTGPLTGNASGTAATVTGGTQAAITSAANLVTVGTIGTGVWQGTAIASGYIAGDAITGAKIADCAIDSEHYTDGSIDAVHLAADVISAAKIADCAIDSEHYTDGSIDSAHIADNQVTLAKMAGLTRGSIIYGNSSGDPTALAKGCADEVLTSDGTDIAWAAASGGGGGASALQVNDSVAFAAGTGSDSKIYYDGTDTHWDLRDTGSGALVIALGACHPSPDGNAVHIWEGTAGSVVARTSSMLVLESCSCDEVAIQFLMPGGGSSQQAIWFGDAACATMGSIIYDHGDNQMRIGTGGSGRAIFTTNGFLYKNGCKCTPAFSFICNPCTGMYRYGACDLALSSGGSEKAFILTGSQIYMADCINGSHDTYGLTINQVCKDNAILSFKSSDVTHGLTADSETDTYGFFKKSSAGDGGLHIHGLTQATNGIRLAARVETEGTTKSAAISCSSIHFCIAKHDGANGDCSFATDANLFSIRKNDGSAATRFIFDVEGTFHADVGSTTYDDYCDVEVLRGVLAETVPCYKENYQERFGKDLMYNLCFYEENKLIGKDSIWWEKRPCGRMQQRAMINFTGLTMLHHSTIIQLADRVDARLTALENQIALQGGK